MISSNDTIKTDLPWITSRNMDFLKDLEPGKDIPASARHLNGIRQAVHLRKASKMYPEESLSR